MSVVIKGKKMPENCLKCDFTDHFGNCWCRDKEPYKCDFTMEERPDWCPIIAELPEKHGPLVDLEEWFKYMFDAPTVLKAEGDDT